MEVISTLLKTYDRVIIVDPEDEYSDIGREFGAQMIDVTQVLRLTLTSRFA